MEQGKDVLSIMPNTRIDLIFCFSYPTLIKVLYELFIQFLRWLAYTVADFLACRPRDDPLSSQRDHSGHAKVIKLIFITQLNFYLWLWFPNIHDFLLCFDSGNNKIPQTESFTNNRNVLLTVLTIGVLVWLGKSRSATDRSFDPLLAEPARVLTRLLTSFSQLCCWEESPQDLITS